MIQLSIFDSLSEDIRWQKHFFEPPALNDLSIMFDRTFELAWNTMREASVGLIQEGESLMLMLLRPISRLTALVASRACMHAWKLLLEESW